MADTSCCQLVGDLNLNIQGCVTSISTDANTEYINTCDELKAGPTVGTVNVTGIARNTTYVGCPSKAGVSIPWIRKYDCEADIVYFIKGGEGSSFISTGDGGSTYVNSLVELKNPSGRRFVSMNASSNSGPMAIYMEAYREEGYGLIYSGDLFDFDTGEDLIFSNFGIGEGPMYLQNFSIDFNPGSYPTANFSFAFTITD